MTLKKSLIWVNGTIQQRPSASMNLRVFLDNIVLKLTHYAPWWQPNGLEHCKIAQGNRLKTCLLFYSCLPENRLKLAWLILPQPKSILSKVWTWNQWLCLAIYLPIYFVLIAYLYRTVESGCRIPDQDKGIGGLAEANRYLTTWLNCWRLERRPYTKCCWGSASARQCPWRGQPNDREQRAKATDITTQK